MFAFLTVTFIIYFISSPSGDGNNKVRISIHSNTSKDLFYFFPVRGRKRSSAAAVGVSFAYLFYFFPVRGRKLVLTACRSEDYRLIYFISSPSGDGNVIRPPSMLKKCTIYFISSSSGDGNHSPLPTERQVYLFILFFPRQGTETYTLYRH